MSEADALLVLVWHGTMGKHSPVTAEMYAEAYRVAGDRFTKIARLAALEAREEGRAGAV